MSWGDYESSTVRALRSIDSTKYNKEFTQNMQSLNYATDFMADYMIIMQKGIDDANKDVIQKIQDFIEDLIIIFGGGEYGDSGFEWGDLGYIIQAIGALFGFGDSGPIDLFESAAHFLGNFLEPLGLFGDIINGFIKAIFEFFANLLSNVPIVGDALEEIVTNVADGINSTTSTANTANTTANTANTTANTANTNASTALSTAGTANTNATAAQTAASNAASVAAVAQETADIAYENAQYNKDEFAVSSAGVVLGKNEETLGILMTTPDLRIRKITRVIYSFGSNTSTATIQLIRKTVGGTESVVLTTNVTSGAIVYPDNTIDYTTTDLDHYMCNVTALGGTANTLHCCIESVILEA
jgi:hypothetical protein